MICDLEKGLSRNQIKEKYGLKKKTMHDILKAKDKVREVMKRIEVGKKRKFFALKNFPMRRR